MEYVKLFVIVMYLLIANFEAFAQTEKITCKLTQSTSENVFWTTAPSVRVFKNTPEPVDTDSSIKVFCAKNESEPFVAVVKPKKSGTISVSMGDFGSGIVTDLNRVMYVDIKTPSDNLGRTGFYPDPIMPLRENAVLDVMADENTELWITITVPSAITSGDYSAKLTLGSVTIPVKLHVFNFTVPSQLHISSQMNFSYETFLKSYGVSGTGVDYWKYVENINNFFISHRLTPRNPLWPGGLTSGGGECFISYDCNGGVSDPHGIWGFESPATKYIKGDGFNNGTGFPVFQAISFRNNDASVDQRPDTFCTIPRGVSDWYTGNNPQSVYNKKWFSYLKSLQDYLGNHGLLGQSYYYMANEPQNQKAYDAVAWYSQEIKKAAPKLKIMVSEEPKKEIFGHTLYTGAKVDIWLPVLNNYNPDISWEREKNNGEQTWIYFLHGTRPPYFNPITLDHPGIESKLTGWFLWKYRIRGIAYYSLNEWSRNPWVDPLTDGHNGDLFMLYPPSQENRPIPYGQTDHCFVSSVRFELMRDGFEDYEYLYLLNNSKQPEVYLDNLSDVQSNKIISNLTSYSRDDEFIYNLRRLIGLKLGGELNNIPDIRPKAQHPRALETPGDYFINFQNPAGEPVVNPLVVNGNTFMKIGWNSYNDTLGYGWFGDMANVKYQYLSSGPNELQKSVIYDDWGRQKTFEFDCPNGQYDVTVSVGWTGKTYQHQKIKIEGVDFVNDEATTAANPYLVRSAPVIITDNKLTMAMGIFDEYTMLNYMTIKHSGLSTVLISKDNVSKGFNLSRSGTSLLMEFRGLLPDKVRIYDLSGKCVLTKDVRQRKTTFVNSHFRTGIYCVELRYANNSVFRSVAVLK